jgi:hypothetical protein
LTNIMHLSKFQLGIGAEGVFFNVMNPLDNLSQRRTEMKKVAIRVLVLVCLILFASMAFAQNTKGNNPVKQDREQWFNPSLSIGYAYIGETHITFTSPTGLLGARKIDVKVPDVSGIYLAGELPFALTDRLKLTLGGRWAFSLSNPGMEQKYNHSPIIGREWDSDGRDWVTTDLLLSYILVKNVLFLKDISTIIGFRWDYNKMRFDNAHNPIGVASSPLDTIAFSMNTYSPVLGLTSTFKGFKSGIFGGDMKLGVFGSPFAWGDMKYSEEFGAAATRIRFDDDFNNCYYFNLLGEITALSGKITTGVEASLSIFAQYTKFYVKDNPTGVADTGGIPVARSDFDFRVRPDLTTVGIKASVAF